MGDETIRGSLPDVNEVQDIDETQEVIPFAYSITSYGADYPVDSLVKRVDQRDIIVPRFQSSGDDQLELSGFQRAYVWNRSRADRFVESLLLGLPVPGIFLVKEESGRLLVLDGHQRLYTLHAFYRGVIDGVEYRLRNVQPSFTDRTYKELETEDRRRLDDAIIHATIVRQDEPTNDQSSIYMVFERLNTGGMSLQPQEIRIALYHGEFAQLLAELNADPHWRNILGPPSKRLKDMELILRFFALRYFSDTYRAPMKDFLNRYMAANRELGMQSRGELAAVFMGVVELLDTVIGRSAFRPRRAVNAAVVDSVLTGLSRRLERGAIADHGALGQAYGNLVRDEAYLSTVETGTSQEANVRKRLELATGAFADLT